MRSAQSIPLMEHTPMEQAPLERRGKPSDEISSREAVMLGAALGTLVVACIGLVVWLGS